MPHVLRRTSTALAAAALALIAAPGTATAAQWQGDPRDLPDPSILVVEQAGQPTTYYAYATQVWQRTNVQVTASTDLHSWSPPTEAMPTLGSWATSGNTWAPGALRRGDRFLLYYTATHAREGRQCIGVATSTAPTGPFVDSSATPLVCQLDSGGSIDADTLVMPDGALYLHWKSDDNAIGGVARLWGQRLASDGLSFQTGTAPRELLRYDARWEKPLIEGPQMVHVGGRFFLFYGAGSYASDKAAVGYATCTGPLGGCTKVTTKQGWLRSDAQRSGPAGPSFFQRPGGGWLVAYHAWQPGAVGYQVGGSRSLWLTDVSFTSGAPVLVR